MRIVGRESDAPQTKRLELFQNSLDEDSANAAASNLGVDEHIAKPCKSHSIRDDPRVGDLLVRFGVVDAEVSLAVYGCIVPGT